MAETSCCLVMIKQILGIAIFMLLFFFVSAKNSFVNPNNLWEVFDQSEKDTLNDIGENEALPIEASNAETNGAISFANCNFDLTRALATKVVQSMSKYRSGDLVRTTVVFYLSWEDATTVSEFMQNSTLAEIVTQSFVDNIKSTTLDTLVCPSCPQAPSSIFNFENLFQIFYLLVIVILIIYVSKSMKLLIMNMTLRRFITVAMVLILTATFVMRYLYLHQLEKSKMEAKMHKMRHQLPSHCSVQDSSDKGLIGLIAGLWYGKPNNNECEEFFKMINIDPTLKVTPLQVLYDVFFVMFLKDVFLKFLSDSTSAICKPVPSIIPCNPIMLSVVYTIILFVALCWLFNRDTDFSLFYLFHFRSQARQGVRERTCCQQTAAPAIQQPAEKQSLVVNVNASFPLMHSQSSPGFFNSPERIKAVKKRSVIAIEEKKRKTKIDKFLTKRLKQIKLK